MSEDFQTMFTCGIPSQEEMENIIQQLQQDNERLRELLKEILFTGFPPDHIRSKIEKALEDK